MNYRREEPRFPIEMPATILVDSQELKGSIKNISLHGLKVQLPCPAQKGERISLYFPLPHTEKSFENLGNICWCQESDNQYSVGIKADKPNDITLPLYLLSSGKQEIFTQDILEFQHIPSLSLDVSTYFPENMFQGIYAGFFFATFQHTIQEQLVRMSCDLELSVFYLKKLSNGLKEKELQKLTGELKEINKKMQFLQNTFNNQINLLRLLDIGRKKISEDEDLPESICLNELLTSRLHHFQELLASLMVPHGGEIVYKEEKVPPLLVDLDYLTNGLDLLILFSYHTLFISTAKKIWINIYYEPPEGIICEFINDGSRLFKKMLLEVECETLHTELSTCLGNKHYFWLCYALSFFKNQNAKLSILSESGNNQIRLKIPLE